MRAADLTFALALAVTTSCSGGGASDSPLGGPGNPQPAGAFVAQGGLLVVEFESSLDAGGDWTPGSSMAGHTGTGYLTWTGPNLYQTPGQDAFGFDFVLAQAGRYHFRLHNRHDHPDSTLANDLWVRMDGGAWVKAFSWQRGQWTWATQHEFSHNDKPPAEYTLTAGTHRIEFSGRSADFSVDRFHLYLDGTPNPEDVSHPESPRQAGLVPPASAQSLDGETRGTRLVELTGGGEEGAWELAAGDPVDGGRLADATLTAAVPADAFVGASRSGDDLVVGPEGSPLRVFGGLRAGVPSKVAVRIDHGGDRAALVLRDSGGVAVMTSPLERIDGALRGSFTPPGAGTFGVTIEAQGRVLLTTTFACLDEQP